MGHYKHLGFVDLINVMQSFCRFDEEKSVESRIWQIYSPQMKKCIAQMNSHLNEVSFETTQRYEEICKRESWQIHAIQSLLEGYITVLYDTKPEAYRVFKEIRNIFVPDGERIKVRRYASELSGIDERERILPRYVEFMRSIPVPENNTLFSLVQDLLDMHDEKIGFLAVIGEDGAQHLLSVEQLHLQNLALFNRVYEAMRDEMKMSLIAPILFSKLFAHAEELEMQIDQRVRRAEHSKSVSDISWSIKLRDFDPPPSN